MQPYTLLRAALNNGFNVQQATLEDAAEIQTLLIKTAEWLKSTGSTQWNQILAGKDSHDTGAAIERGEVFVFKHEGVIAAMVILMTEASPWDIKLWGAETNLSTSVFVHRLAINRDYAGLNVGSAVLDWIINGIHIEGKPLVRLDCIEGNDALFRLYSGAGFQFKGAIHGFNLFEKSSI